jgi:LmbE family N-acetylglucosaminyl deacetylase
MTARPSTRRFTVRPGDPDAWVRAPEPSDARPSARDPFTAKLTIDVTPEMRVRVRMTAFLRSQTVAGVLRDLLTREFSATDGGQK